VGRGWGRHSYLSTLLPGHFCPFRISSDPLGGSEYTPALARGARARGGYVPPPKLIVSRVTITPANETAVQLWTANYTSNQQWLVQEQGDGTYLIYAYSGKNSLQMLDLTNSSTANGNLVNTYQQNNTPAQSWLFVPEGKGDYRIVPKSGENTAQTLDIQNGSLAGPGSRTDVYTYGGGSNQVRRSRPWLSHRRGCDPLVWRK
jgi:hypothetical protein